jgi:hypothetical protein
LAAAAARAVSTALIAVCESVVSITHTLKVLFAGGVGAVADSEKKKKKKKNKKKKKKKKR